MGELFPLTGKGENTISVTYCENRAVAVCLVFVSTIVDIKELLKSVQAI